MSDRFFPRRFFVHGFAITICALGILAGGFFLMQASRARGPLPMTWLAASLLGVWLLLILGRRLHARAQQTIAMLVSEATTGSSSVRFVDGRQRLVDSRPEARESELALLQMTLGPRVY